MRLFPKRVPSKSGLQLDALAPVELDPSKPTVLHGKFSAYLAWSQPFIYSLLSGLSAHFNNVVICNRTDNLDRFPIDNIQRITKRFLIDPSRTAVAANNLRLKFQPDLMHGHFGWSAIRMLMLKLFLRIPLVTTFGGRDSAVQMHLPPYRSVYRVLLDASEQIICVSRDIQRQLLEAGAEASRLHVVHRGTDLERFAFVDRSDRPPEAPVRILMVGRLVEKKGHAYALEALREVVARGRPVRLTVVGEGELYQDLRRLRRSYGLAGTVSFDPPTDQDGVRRYLEDADILLHCSITGDDGDREGIPNVVVEAAATGLPVIGSEHGGIVEVIRHGETGFLVKERDTAGLSEALERLVSNTAARLEMGRAGRRLMCGGFDVREQVRRHVEIYSEAVSRSREAGDADARSRIPGDIDVRLREALNPAGYAQEFSISELFEDLVSTREPEILGMPSEPGPVSSVYELRRFVPQRVKFPAKVGLREILVALIRLRSRMHGSVAIDPGEDLGGLVLRYFAAGGELEALLGSQIFRTMPPARRVMSLNLREHVSEHGAL